jgi:hypothetical protein
MTDWGWLAGRDEAVLLRPEVEVLALVGIGAQGGSGAGGAEGGFGLARRRARRSPEEEVSAVPGVR